MKPPNSIITLYHGTTATAAQMLIDTQKIDLKRGSIFADFGQGFYMTSSLPQAIERATTRHRSEAAVIEASIDLQRFSRLRTRAFAMAWPDDHNGYWTLVHWCRKGKKAHKSTPTAVKFDVIIGPVSARRTEPPTTHEAMDQVCFLTKSATDCINGALKRVPFAI